MNALRNGLLLALALAATASSASSTDLPREARNAGPGLFQSDAGGAKWGVDGDWTKPLPLPGKPCRSCSPLGKNPPPDPSQLLSEAEVGRVIAQAVAQARASNAVATIAVSDRVGNILAVYRMAGAVRDVQLSTTAPGQPGIDGGLEGLILPAAVGGDALAAIAKAITGAYISSGGNAFSTRTANQIVQEHFNPGEFNQPAGPLFGVQFSQLACSDFMRGFGGAIANAGPKRSPLGLSADPGGMPLYKGAVLVGGVGVMADGRYGIDRSLADFDRDTDELIALAATRGFEPPADIRADRITVEGKTFRFVDARAGDVAGAVANASFGALGPADGSLLAVPGYSTAALRAGTAFGHPASGIRPAVGRFPGRDAFVFVDPDDVPRFDPRAGGDGAAALAAGEVEILLDEALGIANRARAQIRRPLGSQARVTISVVDSQGTILGMARTRDAPVFGADVSLQKARSAAFFSSPQAAAFLAALDEPAVYLTPQLAPRRTVDLRAYLTALRSFVQPSALADGTAYAERTIGNLARPFYPDGILGRPHGPLSKPAGEWSVFSTGLQLDLSINAIVQHIAHTAGLPGFDNDTPANCAAVALGSGTPTAPGIHLANGLQIFPGAVPVYRGGTLVGAIGVSGDGIDQDDMVAFLGLANAGTRLGGAIGHAPADRRADRLTPQGVRLRYVQCPYSPFLDSNAQNVCAGL
jgi:uncharacterized protein GlcG (DUF336 family)